MSNDQEIITGIHIPLNSEIDHPAALSRVLHELASCCARHLIGGGYFSSDESQAILGEYHAVLGAGSLPLHLLDFVAYTAEQRVLARNLDRADEVRRIQKVLRWSVTARVPPWAFGTLPGKPDSLYQYCPELRFICQRLACPAVMSSDPAIVHLATINPFAALVTASWIERKVAEVSGGTIPFVFPMVVDLLTWQTMTHRHFDL